MGKGARIWRITWHVAAILAALVLIFFVVVVPWGMTGLITTRQYHFPDPNDGKSPVSYGLKFQTIQFHSRDGVLIRGWYIPADGPSGGLGILPKSGHGGEAHASRGTIFYCHGQNRTRIEMLPDAVFAHGLGYGGVLFDFRNQGQSDRAIMTVGYNERLDVLGAVDFAEHQLHAPHPYVVWGVSMGAAAALLAASESKEVDAVISDSSFLSFEDTAYHHWRLFFSHIPSFPMVYEVLHWVAWRGNFHLDDFDVRKAVERINPRPILFVAVAGDRRMPPSIAQALDGLASSPDKMLVVLSGTRHGEGFNSATVQYEDAVKRFLTNLETSAQGVKDTGLP
jgi:uncharacterized protein